jgi:hypothetical protein|tara:strand:+ start:285 stop:443 length:159 start_codon:yes stop_codon:yes gene_type:complete
MFKGPNGVGKGDKPRGMKISRREFENRWDKIFKHNGLSKEIFEDKDDSKKKK